MTYDGYYRLAAASATLIKTIGGHLTFIQYRCYFTSVTRESNSLLLIYFPFLTVMSLLRLLVTATEVVSNYYKKLLAMQRKRYTVTYM